MEARQVFSTIFNVTISREEHKTIFSGLRISEITLSNQSNFLGFFNPRKVNLNSGLGQAGIGRPWKMTLGSWFHQILFKNYQDDSPASPNHGR
jgi:hypothetical protein